MILYVNSFEKLEILCLEVELLTHLREQCTDWSCPVDWGVGGKELQTDPISVLDLFSFPSPCVLYTFNFATLYILYILDKGVLILWYLVSRY